MSLDLAAPELAREVGRLHAYVTVLLERASERALRLHADFVSIEHFVGAALEDEESAASQAVEHAFADPETLSYEMLALSPGMMVVGSGAALAFSPRAVDALTAARAEAAASAAEEVGADRVLRHCVNVLSDESRSALVAAGYTEPPHDAAPGPGGVAPDGPLFKHFTDAGKRILSLANKAAFHAREATIGPAQILLSTLKSLPELAAACGLEGGRAPAALAGRTADPTPPAPRPLRPDAALLDFLRRLPDGGGSVAVLSECHAGATPELQELLLRHKVTTALLERAEGAFADAPA